MKIMIAIPCFDHMDYNFVQCLCDLQKVDQTDIAFCGSSLIFDARNRLAAKAIKGGYDYVLWLDSDMMFEPTLLKDLLATGKDLVSALFFSRKPPLYKPCFYKTCKYETEGLMYKPIVEQYWDYPKDQLFEVEAFGFGAVLTKVSTLDAIASTMGMPFVPIPGFGEDLSFCLRAKQLEVKMYTDSRIKVGHLGKLQINEEIFLSQGITGDEQHVI